MGSSWFIVLMLGIGLYLITFGPDVFGFSNFYKLYDINFNLRHLHWCFMSGLIYYFLLGAFGITDWMIANACSQRDFFIKLIESSKLDTDIPTSSGARKTKRSR